MNGELYSMIVIFLFTVFVIVFFLVQKLNELNKKKNIRYPKIGELWEFKYLSSDPWSDSKQIVVKIIDVKEGWVRYAWQGTTLFQDERVQLSTFVKIYEFKEGNGNG